MTRQEYKARLIEELKPVAIQPYFGAFPFPRTLRDVAVDMFQHPTRYSQELQDETRRRLKQLDDTAITDP